MKERRSVDREQAIAVVDLGGQYCHMIGRRLRDMGIRSQSFQHDVSANELQEYAGVILSGGPDSVYDPKAPTIDKQILKIGKPILGICYGHQLLAKLLGSQVVAGSSEFGKSFLHLRKEDSLFKGTPHTQPVWMSHSDSVARLHEGLEPLAETASCRVAAFADRAGRYFGVQFHPEVAHTTFGTKVLENFGRDICKISTTEQTEDLVERLLQEIRDQVGNDSVFFFVSGGVDSTVAFSLCARALPRDRVLGVYVDTGLMRKNETEELRELFDDLGLGDRFITLDKRHAFLSLLEKIIDPEDKRRIIGKKFVEIQHAAMLEFGIETGAWLLGQGTIYPDTVESGGVGPTTALIKTHHNRCDEIRALIEAGKVIEPLRDFYKDEVREIGRVLGLADSVVDRWPFPGPGLAIRCLCSNDSTLKSEKVPLPREFGDYEAADFAARTVGVQGDVRTYSHVAAVRGKLDYARLGTLSTMLCNTEHQFNRVIVQIAGTQKPLTSARLIPAHMSLKRIELLRETDYLAKTILESKGQHNAVWQFPVVLVPISFGEGECIVLRPVNSHDGMTANFAQLPIPVLTEIAEAICALDGVDVVFLDATDKPPATIEWE
jgi:GMP synthase (glutamine-hydrolysing)